MTEQSIYPFPLSVVPRRSADTHTEPVLAPTLLRGGVEDTAPRSEPHAPCTPTMERLKATLSRKSDDAKQQPADSQKRTKLGKEGGMGGRCVFVGVWRVRGGLDGR